MHVAVAQACTLLSQEQHRASTAEQVREMHAARVSYDALLPDLKHLYMYSCFNPMDFYFSYFVCVCVCVCVCVITAFCLLIIHTIYL